jgi:hypothetical protein
MIMKGPLEGPLYLWRARIKMRSSVRQNAQAFWKPQAPREEPW